MLFKPVKNCRPSDTSAPNIHITSGHPTIEPMRLIAGAKLGLEIIITYLHDGCNTPIEASRQARYIVSQAIVSQAFYQSLTLFNRLGF
jgi:hypothetical protein